MGARPARNDGALGGVLLTVVLFGVAVAQASDLRTLVERHARENEVPPDLAHAVVMIESGYNPRARSGPNIGLMQIQHRTARGLGYRGSTAGLLEAETNLTYGMRYLAQAYRAAGGDICRTILKYTGGHRATRMSKGQAAYCSRAKTIMAKSGPAAAQALVASRKLDRQAASAAGPVAALSVPSPSKRPAAASARGEPVPLGPLRTALLNRAKALPFSGAAIDQVWSPPSRLRAGDESGSRPLKGDRLTRRSSLP